MRNASAGYPVYNRVTRASNLLECEMVRHEACPHCGGQLIGWNDSDTSCLQCGHVVYPSNRLGSNLLEHDVDIDPAKTEPPNTRKTRTPE